MSHHGNTVYPLADPTQVDVAAIERELEELWRGAAEATSGQGGVMHAAAFTLIFALRAETESGMAMELLSELAGAHPSRAILLKLGAASVPDAPRAWVTAYCHKPAPDSQQVCSEAIILEYDGTDADADAVASLLLSLRLAGLPLALIWDASLPAEHSLLAALRERVERVIVSVIPPCGPASLLETFFKLRDAFGTATVTTDLIESLIRPWRLAVARLFDAESAAAIREVHLRYANPKIPAEMLLLAAWMASALEWEGEHFVLQGSEPVIRFANGRSIAFHGRQAAEANETIEFILESGRMMRVDEPAGDNRLSSLLLLELQIWGHDPLREQYLARARSWLKEILFL